MRVSTPRKYRELVNNIDVYGLEETMRACKFPMSVDLENIEADDKRLKALACTPSGSGHDNALMGVVVQFDLTFTNKAWVEAERYHFLDIVSSQSTMHRITKFKIADQFIEYTNNHMLKILAEMIDAYNSTGLWWSSKCYEPQYEDTLADLNLSLEDWKKEQYLKILYSVPSGMKITARMVTNYRQLKTIYQQRRDHRLPEWRLFCRWLESLPMAKELICS